MTTSLPETPPQAERPRGRLARMPRVVTGLVAVISLAFVASLFLDAPTQEMLFTRLGVTPALILMEAPHAPLAALEPFFGHVFLHGGWLHLIFNAFLILQTGELVAERFGRTPAGAAKFLALFFGSGVAGAALFVALNPQSQSPAIGASGAASGLFAAYLLALAPTWRLALRAPQVWQMGFYFLLVNVGVAMLARSSGVLPIAWEAHLGGFLGGLLLYPLLAPRRRRLAPWT